MTGREFSWQKENPAGDPAEIARIQADIDARNPTNLVNILVNLFPLVRKKKDRPL